MVTKIVSSAKPKGIVSSAKPKIVSSAKPKGLQRLFHRLSLRGYKDCFIG